MGFRTSVEASFYMRTRVYDLVELCPVSMKHSGTLVCAAASAAAAAAAATAATVAATAAPASEKARRCASGSCGGGDGGGGGGDGGGAAVTAGWRAASAAAWASGTKHPAPRGRITRPFTAGFERVVAITSYARLQVVAMLAQRHAGVGVAAALRIVLVVVHCSTCFCQGGGRPSLSAQQPQEGYTGGGQPKASQGEGWPRGAGE